MGDIIPTLSAEYFIQKYEAIIEEKRKNQTNEGWFMKLSTKEKAKTLANVSHPDDPLFVKVEVAKFWEDWLKRKHFV